MLLVGLTTSRISLDTFKLGMRSAAVSLWLGSLHVLVGLLQTFMQPCMQKKPCMQTCSTPEMYRTPSTPPPNVCVAAQLECSSTCAVEPHSTLCCSSTPNYILCMKTSLLYQPPSQGMRHPAQHNTGNIQHIEPAGQGITLHIAGNCQRC